MMQKKVIGGNVAIVLAIMCIVFVGGLGATIASYTSVINSKDKTHQDYVSTHSHSDTEFSSLDASYQGYRGAHSHTDSEYNTYVANHNVANSEYDAYVANHHHTDAEFDSALTAPRLAAVNLTAEDNGPVTQDLGSPLFGTSTFHVYGYVLNAGANAAYNPKIHVVAIQLGGGTAIDTYITLSTMHGESWTTIDSTFVYSGDSLISWTLTPQWTTTP